MASDQEFTAFTGFSARLGVVGEVTVSSAPAPKARSPDRSGQHVEVLSDSPDRTFGFSPVPEPSLLLMLENLGKMMTVAESWQSRMAADEQADLLVVYAEAVDQLRLSITMAFTGASDENLVTVPKA